MGIQSNLNDLRAKVFVSADLVEYQDGSIVSKQLIKKSVGNITIFAFDAGQELSTHSAPFDAMVQVLEGEALITISGVDYKVKKDELIILPANEPHGVKAEQKFKMLLSMIRE